MLTESLPISSSYPEIHKQKLAINRKILKKNSKKQNKKNQKTKIKRKISKNRSKLLPSNSQPLFLLITQSSQPQKMETLTNGCYQPIKSKAVIKAIQKELQS